MPIPAHQNDFYYINNANYNIVIYLIFAVWQLPLSGGTPAQHLSRHADAAEPSLWICGVVRFALGFGCCWLVPILVEALTAYGVIPYLFG